MLFYLHYILMTSGLSGVSVLLAVYFREYTDASQSEIGVLLMTFPFVSFVIKPLFCSMADRKQAHRLYLIGFLFVEMLGYLPFAIIPFFPTFYINHPRWSWYLLVVACQVGNCGLGVAWSLGECLAMNMAQKNGTPYGRMRLMGTIGWGVYGFIIGQINEIPVLPKYLAAFIILHLSLIIEILVMALWKAEDFVMVDPMASNNTTNKHGKLDSQPSGAAISSNEQLFGPFVDSLPSSLGGTLRLNAHTASVFSDVFGTDADLQKRLQLVKTQQQAGELLAAATTIINKCDPELGGGRNKNNANNGHSLQRKHVAPIAAELALTNIAKTDMKQDTNNNNNDDDDHSTSSDQRRKELKKNPQLVLLKIIFLEDGRLIKYICLFAIYGFLMAPMNFLFLSMEEVCSKRGYNFSQLAGGVLISQAAIETLGFLVVPWILVYVTRSLSLGFSFTILAARYVFYSGWYYTGEISPYWAVIGEWSHGLAFAIFCTVQADVALMFANQSRLFIPELRRLGYLSEISSSTPKELIEAEENSIKMALRATMQAILDGFMNGLGQGVGCLVCGIFIELYDYVSLWRLFYVIALGSFVIHQLIEVSKCHWSDTNKPHKGTKAFEIRQLDSKLRDKQLGGSKVSESGDDFTVTTGASEQNTKTPINSGEKSSERC